MPEFTFSDIWLLDRIQKLQKGELQKAEERAERRARMRSASSRSADYLASRPKTGSQEHLKGARAGRLQLQGLKGAYRND